MAVIVYLYVGIAGFLGSILRYGISIFFITQLITFPFASLCVNLLGSFLLAFITTYVAKNYSISKKIETAIKTGFLGSFTTFSALSLETFQLFEQQYIMLGILYLFISFFGGLLMIHFGLSIGKERKK